MNFIKYFLFIFYFILHFNFTEAKESHFSLAPNTLNNNKKIAYKLKTVIENFFTQNKSKYQKTIPLEAKVKREIRHNFNPFWIMYGINCRTPRIGTSGPILPIGKIGETIPIYFEKETFVPLKSESLNEQKVNYDNFTSSPEYEILKNFLESSDFMNETKTFLNEAGINLNTPKKLFINTLRQILQEVCLILKQEMLTSDKKLNAYLNNQTLLQEKKISYFLALEYLKFIEDFEKNSESLDSYFSLSA